MKIDYEKELDRLYKNRKWNVHRLELYRAKGIYSLEIVDTCTAIEAIDKKIEALKIQIERMEKYED